MNEIDPLLKGYFRREMPSRWPAAPGEETTLARSSGVLAAGRLLIGVSLVGLLAAYLGLATFFPRQQSTGVNPNNDPLIGHRPGIDAVKPR